jgi:hypothetical protein
VSTLKVAAINNPSASSGGLAISASGLVTGAGLDLIVTQSFSAASSVSLNNCFSADYDNYRLTFHYVPNGTNDASIRMRVGGVDSTSSTYSRTLNGAYTNGTDITLGNSGQTSWSVFQGTTAIYSVASMDMTNPFAATRTNIIYGGYLSNSVAQYGFTGAGIHNETVSYTGFTILAASGTITGTVSVYGYRK